MRKEEYKILKKFVPIVKLVSLTERLWYDCNNEKIPWVEGDVIFPQENDMVYNINVTDELVAGNYMWDGSTWLPITIEQTYENFNLPVFLDNTIIDMGVMSEFSGEVQQIEEKCNFTYTGTGSTITLYNSVNTDNLGVMCGAHFTIKWGDGTTDTLPMIQPGDVNLPNVTHTYTGGTYTITVTVQTPWLVKDVSKQIVIPFTTPVYPTDFGVLTFTVPYSEPVDTIVQQYLEDYTTLTGNTTDTTISFLGIGKSRLDEVKGYGDNGVYTIVTGTTELGTYTGYTIDQLFYMDYDDDYTHITGTTLGTPETFYTDEVYNGMITRNEHFIGFIDEPIIYSDIFVERGKLGVTERNLRLGEIESTGEMENYGNGFFKIKKQ